MAYSNQHMYGVLNKDMIHTDVSTSEKGAKNYATRHGYTKVSIRYNLGYHVDFIAEKTPTGRWKKIK
jgi:hypothetical protein